MNSFLLSIFQIMFLVSCRQENSYKATQVDAKSIESRFSCIEGFQRIAVEPNSFAQHLRILPLKPSGSLVTYYDGTKKSNRNVYEAVVELPIGYKDLHQCADAVIRLRADYLYNQKRYEDIHFTFTNGFVVEYDMWRKGNRINISNNTTSWVKTAQVSDDEQTYWAYLEQIFQYAGTASLTKELVSVPIREMQIGDVFIKGGFPGHAVIVVDMAENAKGIKLYMLAQSYMPAQELQILSNPKDKALSPWYMLDSNDVIYTPEWKFTKDQLKRFQ